MGMFRLVCLRLGLYDVGQVFHRLDSSLFRDSEFVSYYVGSECLLHYWDPDHSRSLSTIWAWYGQYAPEYEDANSMTLDQSHEMAHEAMWWIINRLGDSILDGRLVYSLTSRQGVARIFGPDLVEFWEWIAEAARIILSSDKEDRAAWLRYQKEVSQGKFSFDEYRISHPVRYTSEYVVQNALELSKQYYSQGKINEAELFALFAFFEKENSDYYYLKAEIDWDKYPENSKRFLEQAKAIEFNNGTYNNLFFESNRPKELLFKASSVKMTNLCITFRGKDFVGREIEAKTIWATNNIIAISLRNGEYTALVEYNLKTFLKTTKIEKKLWFSVPGPSLMYEIKAGADQYPVLVPR